MSMMASVHFHSADPPPTVEVRVLGDGPTVTIGAGFDHVDLHLWGASHARDLAAGLVAAARRLDEWADKVDPDPITEAAERLIATHEDVAS
jgi:hypothetical protein